MHSKLTALTQYLRHGIWRVRRRALPRRQSYLLRPLRVVLLALRGFDEDQCQLRASALTFFTLLSVVPILAMAFGIAQGFGLEQRLQDLLTEKLSGQGEVLQRLIEFSHTLLDNTKGGLIAGIGIALLFWAVIKMLGNIEQSFNEIWGVKQGRSFGRKLSDYLSVMLICPVLLIVSSSVTVFISSQVTLVTERIALLGPVAPLITMLLNLLPYLVVWVLFTFLYLFMPNTKVSWPAGLFAGIVAGTIYQVVQWVYVRFQVGVAQYNAIYGSFAALPLFLVWLQASWLVLLFGAEISFAVDNEETYEFEHDSLQTSRRFKRVLALRLVELCAKQFAAAAPPLDVHAVAHQLEAPIRLVREMFFELVGAGVLMRVQPDGHGAEAYQPAHDIHRLTIAAVLDALERRGNDAVPLVNDSGLQRITAKLDAFDRLISRSPDNVPLKDL